MLESSETYGETHVLQTASEELVTTSATNQGEAIEALPIPINETRTTEQQLLDNTTTKPHEAPLLPPSLSILPFSLSPTLLYKGDFYTSGSLLRYRTGQIWLEGEQNSLPGIGRINEASALWSQQLTSHLSLQASVVATQLHMEFFHRHVLQLKAQMCYRLTDRLTFHLFGSYDTGNPYNPYGRQWGGSLDWQITPRFGIEGGVRRNYNAVTGRWETLPIAAPYYHFGSNFRLQIDTGPLILQFLKGAIYGHEDRSNPTIAPPKNNINLR